MSLEIEEESTEPDAAKPGFDGDNFYYAEKDRLFAVEPRYVALQQQRSTSSHEAKSVPINFSSLITTTRFLNHSPLTRNDSKASLLESADNRLSTVSPLTRQGSKASLNEDISRRNSLLFTDTAKQSNSKDKRNSTHFESVTEVTAENTAK